MLLASSQDVAKQLTGPPQIINIIQPKTLGVPRSEILSFRDSRVQL